MMRPLAGCCQLLDYAMRTRVSVGGVTAIVWRPGSGERGAGRRK